MDPKTTVSRCTAFVQFDTRREAKDALKFMNGHVLPGAKKGLLVKFAEDHHRRVQRQEQGGGQVNNAGCVWSGGRGAVGDDQRALACTACVLASTPGPAR